jgi:AcrR family transcriptional regulator
MARPKSIDTEEILEAAREVFLEDGIQATTAKIARHAGISEGTIYRRFSTKQDLFVAAMDLPDPPSWVERVEAIDEEGDLRLALYEVALEIVDFFEEVIPKLTMVMSNLDEKTLLGDQGEPPLRVLKPLMRLFERERRRGRIGPCDTEVVSRMFLGSLFHFAFAEISGINEMFPMPRETYARGVVTTLLDGVSGEKAPEDDPLASLG